MKRWLLLHRTLGLWCSFFVLILSFTGIVLLRGDAWKLDQRGIPSFAASWIYRIESPKVTGLFLNQHWYLQCEEHLYRDNLLWGKIESPLVDVATIDFGIGVLSETHLHLFSRDGQQIEKLNVNTQIGLEGPAIGMESQQGQLSIFSKAKIASSPDALDWTLKEQKDPLYFSKQQKKSDDNIPHDLTKHIQSQSLSQAISWERFMLDLHSGRLFGPLGPWIMELSAWSLIALTISGLWIFKLRRPRARN